MDLHKKLKVSKDNIKVWNREKYGNCFSKISILEEQLKACDLGQRPDLSRKVIEQNLLRAYKDAEEILKQKSRITWDMDEDENTRYFHSVVKIRQRKNQIDGIFYNNKWISELDEVKEAFRSHFAAFFKKKKVDSIFRVNFLVIKSLSANEKSLLETSFDKDELFASLSSMDPNKCPGPDGISVRYLLDCWYLIHEDVFQMARVYHDEFTLPPDINSSFISLVPKKPNRRVIPDFRPISLINCSLKIILKLLATRLN